MALTVLVALCAILGLVSADVAPLPFPPSLNSAASGSESFNIGNFLNRNAYARDESKIRQQSTSISNNAEGSRDIATAKSEPIPISPIEPLYTQYASPVEQSYPYYTAPGDLPYPFYGTHFDYANPYYSYLTDQGYYGYPTGIPSVPNFSPPYGVPSDPFHPFYGLPTTGYYDIPYGIPNSGYYGSPSYQPGGILADPYSNIEIPSLDFVDTTLLEALYPEFPFQTHYSANNNFRGVSASANPLSAGSEIVTDNIAYSKDVIPIVPFHFDGY